MTKKLEWLKAKCPICNREYKYLKKNHEPKTCGKFDCLYKYLHQTKQKGGDKSEKEKLATG